MCQLPTMGQMAHQDTQPQDQQKIFELYRRSGEPINPLPLHPHLYNTT